MEIIYEDEVHFYRGTTITRTHAKKGQQPKINFAPTKEKVAFYGLVNPNTGGLFTSEYTTFNYETFIASIKEYMKVKPSEKQIVVVLDNASWHKKGVRLLKEENYLPGKLEFLFLPAYSPDFNPIERVWKITRRKRTHNRYFESLINLVETLMVFLSLCLSLTNYYVIYANYL